MDLPNPLRNFMMNIAQSSVKGLFAAKMGYDLWKLNCRLEVVNQRITSVRELRSAKNNDLSLNSESNLTESKLADDDDDNDNSFEEKNEAFDVEDELRQLEEEQLNGLRCCAIAGAFAACNQLLGTTVLEPSAQLLLTTIFALLWNTQQTMLVQVHDTTFSTAILRMERNLKPLLSFIAWGIAKVALKVYTTALNPLIPFMESERLESLIVDVDDTMKTLTEEARKRKFHELREVVLLREKKVYANNNNIRGKPRMSSAF